MERLSIALEAVKVRGDSLEHLLLPERTWMELACSVESYLQDLAASAASILATRRPSRSRKSWARA